MFASPVETDIAPSGTLLGLLQRGRGDGALLALAAPRAEAVAALHRCVLRDPRQDWQLEHRSLYYARLHGELDAGLGPIRDHLFAPEDRLPAPGADAGDAAPGGDAPPDGAVAEERTGLALSVLGHLASYGDTGALELLRRYAAAGANWRWALDELAVRDDDAGLRELGPAILARFPPTPAGERALAAAVRDAFEPRPWRIWAADPGRPAQRARLARAAERGDFDRWQRQLRPPRSQPGFSVASVLEWVRAGHAGEPRHRREAAAARCLAAVAGPEDRAALLAAAAADAPAVRAAVLRHLAERADPAAPALIEAAVAGGDPELAGSAAAAFDRMRGERALEHARRWADRPDRLGGAAAAMLARHGDAGDAPAVLAALRRTLRHHGTHAPELGPLVEGAGRLAIRAAAPVLRHVYRETASSRLRGRTALALAATDPFFPAGFAVECLWDCEEETREVAARSAASGDARVLERLRRLAADPAERDGVQTAVRGRLGSF